MQKQPIFLISSGRCGSTFFSNSIHDHPKMTSISELFEPILEVPYFNTSDIISSEEFLDILTAQTMSERVDIWLSSKTKECLYMPKERSKISLLLCYTLPLFSDEPEKLLEELTQEITTFVPDTPAGHFINFCELLKKVADKEIWIERSGGSLPHMGEILSCWPKAKVIHFYRDGRQTACSMRAHPVFRAFVMRRLGICWDQSFIPSIEEFGYMWSQWVIDALSAVKKYNADILEISYESLISEPKQTLESFLKFVFEKDTLDEVDHQWIQEVSCNITPAKDHLVSMDPIELAKLNKACSIGMKALGYKEV